MNESEHLLTILAEECAEVQQCVAKALRFGLLDAEAGTSYNNAARIIQELLDLEAVITMLTIRGIIRYPEPGIAEASREAKRRKIVRFMAYAIELGTLSKEGTP